MSNPIPFIDLIDFEVENDNLLHFGLHKGDHVGVLPIDTWKQLSERELCLIEHSSGRRFLAAVEQVLEDIPGMKAGSAVVLYERFFGGGNLFGKKVLTLIGRVVKHSPNAINTLSKAIETILYTEGVFPENVLDEIGDHLNLGMNEIYNALDADVQLAADSIEDNTSEYSFEHNRFLITAYIGHGRRVKGGGDAKK